MIDTEASERKKTHSRVGINLAGHLEASKRIKMGSVLSQPSKPNGSAVASRLSKLLLSGEHTRTSERLPGVNPGISGGQVTSNSGVMGAGVKHASALKQLKMDTESKHMLQNHRRIPSCPTGQKQKALSNLNIQPDVLGKVLETPSAQKSKAQESD